MKRNKREQGFSYIDVMIALVIMMVGILAMTGAVMANLVRSYDTDKQAIAKQLALSTIETVFSAKEIKKDDNSGLNVTPWDSIGNVGNNPVGGVPQGIFLNGFCPIREEEGADGIFGTADDACAAGAPCAGANGTTNTSKVLSGYTRQIVITDVPEGVNEAIKKRLVTVTVRYQVNGGSRQETMTTLVSLYQ
ncbi:MAG: type IV pilus modification PilV family protein [Pyrinomonadaceae bacterium]